MSKSQAISRSGGSSASSASNPSSASSSTQMSAMREVIGAEVLVIDKDPRVRDGMSELLTAARLNVTAVDDPAEAWELLGKRFFSVVVIDLDTPHPNAGIETSATVQVASPLSMVVVLTPRKSYDAAVAAVRSGAVDVVYKEPAAVDYLGKRVAEAASRSLEKRQLDTILRDVREFQDTFLARFMAAERQIVDLEDRLAGRSAAQVGGDIRVLVVAPEDGLVGALSAGAPEGFQFEHASTGGQALDLCGQGRYQLVLVSQALPDLPTSMVVRSIKSASAETLALTFSGPGPGGSVQIADLSQPVVVVPEFSSPDQLIERLDELAEAFRAKERERRYTQSFRERNYDFVRRFVELKDKIVRALG